MLPSDTSPPSCAGDPAKLRAVKLEEEALLLRFYAGKAQAMCRAFQFPPKVAAAATAYLARFYTGCSVLDHHPRDIMLTGAHQRQLNLVLDIFYMEGAAIGLTPSQGADHSIGQLLHQIADAR